MLEEPEKLKVVRGFTGEANMHIEGLRLFSSSRLAQSIITLTLCNAPNSQGSTSLGKGYQVHCLDACLRPANTQTLCHSTSTVERKCATLTFTFSC